MTKDVQRDSKELCGWGKKRKLVIIIEDLKEVSTFRCKNLQSVVIKLLALGYCIGNIYYFRKYLAKK